ncbi:MAG: osmoprotectant transport system substrate-binding protein [Solirubrobacteraceae bacterium]|jgi:osmoprotectant transport system substrate-binding protein|nr:osmoprotectant transport system substrate-binding protein [Solirubrobacteraceae bacterium]
MRLLTALSIAIALAVGGCGGGGGADATPTAGDAAQAPLRIGTKNFTEQFVLGELYRQALETKGFPVELKLNVGSSEIIHEALTGGALDMYPEYLGVLLSEVANERTRPSSPRAAYAAAKAFEERNGFTLLGMTPFSDANAIAVTPRFARDQGVRAIADLGRVRGVVRIGAPPEFRTRFEGLIGLGQRYGLRNVRTVPMTIGEQYQALTDGRVDAAAVFTTAGQLAQRPYVLLEDPRKLFGTQHVAPVISRRALQRFGPRLSATIDAVSRRLTATAMRRMNAAVDLDGRKPDAVADAFLRDQGLK